MLPCDFALLVHTIYVKINISEMGGDYDYSQYNGISRYSHDHFFHARHYL